MNKSNPASAGFSDGRVLPFVPRTHQGRQDAVPKSLSIIIPALNEEAAIGKTIERCLAAKAAIIQNTPIGEVEIIVVSDGSTDLTGEIARSYESVHVIEYEENRGYGAAIKLGFSKGSSDLVGFLDADGTCDPESFVGLCKKAVEESADMVMGSRMHKKSKMPGLRWIGNRMYAALVSYLSGKKISDTATGIRVLRRDSLAKLYPLPTGLHFTPAMTFRALVAGLVVREMPVPYHERTGRSKLHVMRDGLRFLMSIIEIALCFCPLKFFGCTSALFFLAALLYSLDPAWDLIVRHVFQNNFIYRQIAINTFFLAALLMLSIGVVAERVAAALNGNCRHHSALGRMVLRLCSTRKMVVVGACFIVLGIILNIGALTEYLTTRQISCHWGFISVGSLIMLSGMQFAAMGIFELLVTRIVERNGNGNGIAKNVSE
jgi:glycosyltransferase involved in cell wall biosynthesis